mmetsp:Transcript_1563/g.3336  ORF Transcript_1563/g.3336 Transcript_1563/m.3336 type:complete len:629 (-) Transcript_1563:319-2205(-)
MSLPTECGNEGTFFCFSDTGFDSVSGYSEAIDVVGQTFTFEGVSDVFVGNFGTESIDLWDSGGRYLSLCKRFDELCSLLLDVLECLEDGSRRHSQVIRHFNTNTLFLNNAIKPGRINSVFDESIGLQQLHKVFDSSTDFSTDFDFFECQNKVLSGLFSVGSLGKQVTELGIGKFVDSTIRSNAEVPPNTRSRLELDAFEGTRSRLETFVRVFCGNTGSNDVGVNVLVPFLHEVNLVANLVHVFSVESTDFRDVVQRNSHGYLKLGGWHVNTGDSFCHRVLYLKTRVQFQEVEIIRSGIVEVFDSTGPNIPNGLRETLGSTLHLLECIRLSNGGRTFFENLLESTLGRTVTTVQGNGVSVFVSDNLDFQVTGVLTELHDENGRSNNFVRDLDVGILKVFFVVDETDTLTTTSLGGLNHDSVVVSDTSGSFDGFFDGFCGTLRENLVGNGSFLCEFSLQWTVVGSTERSTPWDGRDLCSLGKDVGSNFVTKNTHDRGCWPNEFDSIGSKVCRKLRVFTCVTPTRPHTVYTLFHGNLGNEVYIGVVISVDTSWNLHVGVGQANEFGVGVDVLWRSHGDELNSAFVSEFHVRPLAHGHDRLGGSHTVIGNQNLFDRKVSPFGLNIVLDRGGN